MMQAIRPASNESYIVIRDINRDTLAYLKQNFDAKLEEWKIEGLNGNENRADAINVLKSYYADYLLHPAYERCLDLSGAAFSTISSFSSLELEKFFPHVTKMDFSNCACLRELPQKFPGDIREIDITNCTELQIDPTSIPSYIDLLGCVYSHYGQFIEGQWKNNIRDLFDYEKEFAILSKCGIAYANDDEPFFFFSYPGKLVDARNSGMNSLGWKMHVSVDRQRVEDALMAIAPVISEYNLRFKVLNRQCEIVPCERFQAGMQITIYLEQDGKAAISAPKLKELVARINQALADENIQPGVIPESDAKIVDTDFCSIRNDSCTLLLSGKKSIYLYAEDIGTNFNPAHNPNPLAEVIDPEVNLLTPKGLFENLYDDSISSEMLFVTMLNACVREFVRESEDDEILYLKEEYAGREDIEDAIDLAITVLNNFNVNTELLTLYSHEHIISADYGFENGFKQMLLAQQVRSKMVLNNRT